MSMWQIESKGGVVVATYTSRGWPEVSASPSARAAGANPFTLET